MQSVDSFDLPLYYGPPFGRPFAAILNSRQGGILLGADGWIEGTIDAVRALSQKGVTILSSVGTQSWGFLAWAVGHCDGRQIIVYPLFRGEDPEEWVEGALFDYGLARERTGFAFYKTDCPASRPKQAWLQRDETVIRLADEIYPISIRRGGNLDSMMRREKAAKARINNAFSVDYRPRRRENARLPSADALRRRFREWDCLTHWTHTFVTPWPEESYDDFYRAIVESKDVYPRSAFATLEHILECGKIRGAARNLGGALPNIAFNALSPSEAVRQNSRKGKYPFEPYGIAIEREAAMKLGVQRMEQKWRFDGDLDLTLLPKDSFFAIVLTKPEASILTAKYGCEAVSLED